MLSDKEKEAIEIIKYFKKMKWYSHPFDNGTEILSEEEKQDIDIILNLIEKQSKEIEELKTINQMQKYRIEVIDERELISKDTIKEILGIEEDINNEKLLSLLQTIVDEYARLEDVEDRKVQIEYNNVFNKGVKSVEDKIKAKIEELENQKRQWIEDRDNKHKDSEIIYAIEVLQSLLEKE